MAVSRAENDFAVKLFRRLPRRYDLLAEVLSFGQNGRWRAELVKHVIADDPPRVLDVATGTAGVAVAMARRSNAHITGVDVSEDMLAIGRLRVDAAGLDGRIDLEAARAEELPFAEGTFDAISFTYVLRYVGDPAATIGELARTLRPGGVMAGLDFFVPSNPFWHAAWWLYTRVVLPVAGLLLGGRAWWDVGRFLGPNISGHYRRWPLRRLLDAWDAAGMVDVRFRVMSLGGGIVMWGMKRA
ncbi:MAG TPA: bifunctional demethylmenaquinone methyltransferase/2-methoxy-6-polyprenyl-1,4-benzoquinol methylase [Chloroflexi bacterium]|jgi:demethylmenaquinone methyltransferase/2-methoxy-6-polyprenyl-1,4-benzoquinol methylase|nr:bifunctional demethylmenaquinone methyltransferase/2-methoxy-6-polyprenyl-1,4-benzoquinol methylase [Chloroflexota bacterium]HAF19711.1 bifunctional demethylmenaquinone methyltransferase/2-methoxy-6-polyprenyl-1,4-benzoquinol methylase [Chloroflexota bacterium]